jgi:hypothetical protein
MKARCLCLILLVLTTTLDDALARATPEPDDDAWAAQNNDYIPAPLGDANALQRRLDPAPTPGDLPAPVSPWSLPARPGRSAARGPDLLYLFMSLRC